jgi:hypothetical protein
MMPIHTATPESIRRRRWRRLLRPLAFAAMLLAGAWYATSQVPAYVRQSDCLRYAPPPETLVFDNDRAAMARLLSSPGYGLVAATLDPPRPAAVGRISPALDPRFRVGTIFIHRLRSSEDYNQRLVMVAASIYNQVGDTDGLAWICAGSFSLCSLLPGSNCQQHAHTWYTLRRMPGQRLRFFAARPIANDPTGFTFDYELGDSHGTIDGWLHDDSTNGVVLRDRTGFGLSPPQMPDEVEVGATK